MNTLICYRWYIHIFAYLESFRRLLSLYIDIVVVLWHSIECQTLAKSFHCDVKWSEWASSFSTHLNWCDFRSTTQPLPSPPFHYLLPPSLSYKKEILPHPLEILFYAFTRLLTRLLTPLLSQFSLSFFFFLHSLILTLDVCRQWARRYDTYARRKNETLVKKIS